MTREGWIQRCGKLGLLNYSTFWCTSLQSHEESKDYKSDFENCILETVALKGNPGTTH